MRHDLFVSGHAFRLRPIDMADAPFAAQLRGDPALNAFIHGGTGCVEAQQRWMADYFERPADYYFVVDALRSGEPQGLISLYDIDSRGTQAEWGRWIMRPGSLAAVESAWLIYKAAFEHLDLNEVYCRTVADNQKVVSFHDSCGITDRRVLPGHFELRGARLDAVEHRVHRAEWPELSVRLGRIAQLTSRRIARVE